MALTPEQIAAAHKANLETLFGLTNKAFEGVEKIVELNMAATRAALSEAASHSQALLNAKDIQELVTLQTSLFQPLAEKRRLTTVTCTTSLPALLPKSARRWKARPANFSRASTIWWTPLQRTLQPARKPL